MIDFWAGHEVRALFGRLDEDARERKDLALIFFKQRYGVHENEIMKMLAEEWRNVQGAKDYFEHEREALMDAAAESAPDAERMRVLLETMRDAMLEANEARGDGSKKTEDRTGPSLELIDSAEGLRDFFQEYPANTRAYMNDVYKLVLEEITSVDRMQRQSVGRFASRMFDRVKQSHDAHIAALIGPVVDWLPLYADVATAARTVRNCLAAFRKKNT